MKNKVFLHIDGRVDELRILSPREVIQLASEVRKGYKARPWEYSNEKND